MANPRGAPNLNRDALRQLRVEKALALVPRATHLSEEPGAREEVARLAQDWFDRHFIRTRERAR